MKIKNIGADPEFAAIDSQGMPFSLIPFIKGSKDKKAKIKVEGCFQQIDNVLVEFDLPPQPTYSMLKVLINNCVKETQDQLSTKLHRKVILYSPNYVIYPDWELRDEKAWEIGCSPYENIYDDEVFTPTPYSSGLRTIGHHIHFSFEEKLSKEEMQKFIFACDLCLGENHLKNDPTASIRMKYYGRLGEYRIKSDTHLEYRSLGGNAYYNPFLHADIERLKNLTYQRCEDLWNENYLNYKEVYGKNSSLWNS